MARTSKPKKEAEFLAPFLPALASLPDRPELVEHVKRYEHNAKTTMKDEQKCFEIIGHRLNGRGVKWTARTCGVSPHTVRAVEREAEARGILAPLKERTSRMWGQILVETQEEILEKIDQFPPNVLPVLAGIAADKKALADGQPGLIVEHRGPVIDVESANNFWIQVSSPENQSGVLGLNHQQLQGAPVPWAHSGAQSSLANGPVIEAELVAPAAEAADPTAAPTHAEGGGGGREISTGAAMADASPSGAKFAKASSDTEPPSLSTAKILPEEKPPA